MNKEVCFSHLSDHWATPKKLYNYFMDLGFVDPCPLHCLEDNLEKDYFDVDLFINPPYSDIESWVRFIKRNLGSNNIIFLLIPARTDTKYFHELLKLNPCIYFIKGRLHFNEKGCAPFPSILMRFASVSYSNGLYSVWDSYAKES